MKRLACLLVVVLALLFSGCERTLSPQLEAIRESGELVVITRNASTTYYVGRHDRNAGFEHDLVRDFADHLDVDVRFRFHHSIGSTKKALREGHGRRD